MFIFFKQKTAYEMRISDWSSDVCSSDLHEGDDADRQHEVDDEQDFLHMHSRPALGRRSWGPTKLVGEIGWSRALLHRRRAQAKAAQPTSRTIFPAISRLSSMRMARPASASGRAAAIRGRSLPSAHQATIARKSTHLNTRH